MQEVIRYQEMTPVPLAPAVVARADQPARADRDGHRPAPPAGTSRPAGRSLPMNVVVRTDDGAVSLLVDEIGDVLEVAQDAFERPPER